MTTCRILVLRLGAMGDVLHALPAVATLKQSFPRCFLSWAIDQKWTPLLTDNPFIDEVLPVDRKSVASLLGLRRRLRHTHYDFAVDFQGLIKSALIASSGRPDRIYGFDRSEVREALAALFYSHATKTHSPHVIDKNLELAQATGATNIVRSSHIPVGCPEGELPSGEFVLANPLAGWAGKQWPLEFYAELAERLRSETGMPLVVNNGGPMEPIPGAHMHTSSLAGLIHATRRAAAVVGVDSGPLHLAAALGKPGVAIFGPTDPARNGPYGGTMTVLRSPNARTTYKRHDEISESMREITVDAVLTSLKTSLYCSAQS
jgi:heptosyltransferase-1